MAFFVYILRSSSNQLYIGQTSNLEHREKQHVTKGWTRAKKEALSKKKITENK
jgi:predicted GIY-YIG superfamily endonuclease